MEMWLSWNNNEERLRLPVLPPDFELLVANINTRVNVNAVGNINLIGKPGLAEMDISSFFPAQDYYFVEYNGFPGPYECVNIIDKWRKTGDPIRLIITDTNINIAMAIDSFPYGERDGTGDVYYTLSMSEYRFLKVKKQSEYPKPKELKRPAPELAPIAAKVKTYTVKKGDTLWGISKKLTGNAMNYKKLAKSSGIKNPNVIRPGQVIKL